MARKEYTAVSLEPDATEAMRAMRRQFSARAGADVSLSDAAIIAEKITLAGYSFDEAVTYIKNRTN